MQATYWHNYAYMYRFNDLTLPEIVKAWMINTFAGVIEDDVSPTGYKVLNNDELYETLILVMIRHYPDDQQFRQVEIGEAIKLGRKTVSRLIQSLEDNGRLSYDRKHSHIEILDDSGIPLWMREFGKALIEIHFDEELRQRLAERYETLQFRRGFQALWDEIKQYTPRRKHKNPRPSKKNR